MFLFSLLRVSQLSQKKTNHFHGGSKYEVSRLGLWDNGTVLVTRFVSVLFFPQLAQQKDHKDRCFRIGSHFVPIQQYNEGEKTQNTFVHKKCDIFCWTNKQNHKLTLKNHFFWLIFRMFLMKRWNDFHTKDEMTFILKMKWI